MKIKKQVRYGFLLIALTIILVACADDPKDTQLPVLSNGAGESTAGNAPTIPPAAGYPGNNEPYPGTVENSSEDDFEIPSEGVPQFPGKLAFHTEDVMGLQVALLDGAGSNPTFLTKISGQAFEPSWSPDCQSFSFTWGDGSDGDFEVYINKDGGIPQPLFVNPSNYDWAAAWSPNGDVFAYQNNKDAQLNICFKDINGNDLGCIDHGNYNIAMPSWSPDGSQIVFGSSQDGNWDIYVTDYPEFKNRIRLTENLFDDYHPQFSPDGQKIVFASKRDGNYDLFVMDPNGSNEVQLTMNDLDNRMPTWVGNEQIAFSSNRTGDWEIYLMNRDGSNVQRLTYHKGDDQWPAWCPNP